MPNLPLLRTAEAAWLAAVARARCLYARARVIGGRFDAASQMRCSYGTSVWRAAYAERVSQPPLRAPAAIGALN